MSWHYLDGSNRQNGPVSDSQLDELLRSGQITPTTLVWREGMTNWQPLNASRALGQSGTVCVECGKAFPPEEIIILNNSPVCAQCKPRFLQRMAESAVIPSFGNLWQQNKRLVTRTETTFPDRCVKCNASAGGFRLKRTLYWAHPAYLLLIFCNLLVLLIVYMIVRKKAVVYIGLCERHRVQRKRGMWIGWGSLVLGFILLCLVGVFNSGWWILAGILTMLIGGITGAVMARTVTPTKIDKEYVWMGGVHRDFLAGLPEWTGT
jgi:hypothetical protein